MLLQDISLIFILFNEFEKLNAAKVDFCFSFILELHLSADAFLILLSFHCILVVFGDVSFTIKEREVICVGGDPYFVVNVLKITPSKSRERSGVRVIP